MFLAPIQAGEESSTRFWNLRSLRWRIDLGILPSSPLAVDDLRRAAADSRRRYASLRRRLLMDPLPAKDEDTTSDLSIDNPLSQNPESTWGRFFRNAELEKTVDQDLTRLYPEDGSYFQTPTCQAMLRRILLLWSLQHPQYGYRQGMHELLAPLVYVLHVDLDHLSQVRKLHEDYFSDSFDESLFPYNTKQKPKTAGRNNSNSTADDYSLKLTTFADLDPKTKQLLLLSDPYGAEGELGVVLSDRFMEHDAYCMFDRLMDGGSRGAVSMAAFFSHSNLMGSGKGSPSPPVIEASSALYHLLNLTDPSLHCHLVELGVEPQYFALRWLRVLFGREFNLEELLMIWDEIFEYPNDTCTDLKAADHGFQIFCSDRGAFIASFGVSMILHLRPALLATENVTVCLQKLLNFPKNVDIKRLIEKARSLHVIALEANENIYGSQSQSLSRSGSNRTPPHHPIPDSYWEERWRVLHKAESLPPPKPSNKDPVHGRPVKKRSFKERLGLVRTESDPSAAENKQAEAEHTVRRQLFSGTSSRQNENSGGLNQSLLFSEESVLFQDRNEFISTEVSASNSMTNDILNGSASRSVQGEDSSTSSVNNDRENYENDTDKSSVTSNSFIGENAEHEVAFTNGNAAEEDVKNKKENPDPVSKETRSVSGKFGWFFKFGRGSMNGDGTDNNTEKSRGETRITDKDAPVSFSNSIPNSNSNSNSNSVGHIARAENCGDKKVMGPLKNLGQSMLENIQVIESVFQQDRGKGQATAMAALTELRNISNLLREM